MNDYTRKNMKNRKRRIERRLRDRCPTSIEIPACVGSFIRRPACGKRGKAAGFSKQRWGSVS